MFGIGDYFKRIKNSFAQEIFVHQMIVEVIKEVTGSEVPLDSIKIKSGTVFLDRASSALKSTIFLKKVAILKKIAERQSAKRIMDIR